MGGLKFLEMHALLGGMRCGRGGVAGTAQRGMARCWGSKSGERFVGESEDWGFACSRLRRIRPTFDQGCVLAELRGLAEADPFVREVGGGGSVFFCG